MKTVKFFSIITILLFSILGVLWILEVIPQEQFNQYALKTLGVLGLMFIASAGLSFIMGKPKETNTKNGPQF